MENYLCAQNGTITPTKCPDGRVNAAGSSSATCRECDYEYYYMDPAAAANASRPCTKRTVVCDFSMQYEVPNALNRTRERKCRALTQCKTIRMDGTSPIDGSP